MPVFYSSPLQNDLSSLFRMVDSAFPQARRLQPVFDIHETKTGYELNGELPGVDQKNVTVEFSDPTTLVIKGRSERSYAKADVSEDASEHKYQASVQDETPLHDETPAPEAKQEPADKYWVSERAVGDFQRSFSFPSTIDADAVKASLKNGILKIVIPKRTDLGAKRVEIR